MHFNVTITRGSVMQILCNFMQFNSRVINSQVPLIVIQKLQKTFVPIHLFHCYSPWGLLMWQVNYYKNKKCGFTEGCALDKFHSIKFEMADLFPILTLIYVISGFIRLKISNYQPLFTLICLLSDKPCQKLDHMIKPNVRFQKELGTFNWEKFKMTDNLPLFTLICRIS